MKTILITVAILVVLAVPLRAQDVSTTGTFTANGQELVLDLNGHGTVSVQLTGTWVATVQFSATVNGTDYFPIPNVLRVSTQTVVTSSTANDTFIIASAAFQKVKAHTTAFTSGTVGVAMVGSPPVSFPSALSGGAASNVTVVNPSLAVTGPLTNTELRAAPVPISASALPLPTGASTSALQTTGNGSLSSIDGKFPAAAALADGTANPTLTKIQTFQMSWNFDAANWSRQVQYVDGDVSTTKVGTLLMGENGGGLIRTARVHDDGGLVVNQGVGTGVPWAMFIASPDGSQAATVTAADGLQVFSVDFDIRNLAFATDKADVSGSTVAVSASALPTGAATAANQASEISSLASIDTKTPALVGGRQPVDGSGVTQPISAASLPLPTGASTAARQDTEIASLSSIDTKTPALVSGRQPVDPSGVTSPISAASLPLPTGASTSANQTNGTQLARTTDGTDTAQVETDQKSSGAATGGLVTREAGQSYLATSAALTTNGQRFTVSTRHFNWANAAFTVVAAGGWDGSVIAVYSTDNGATWATPNAGKPIWDLHNDRAIFEVPFDELGDSPYVVLGGGGATDYGLQLTNTTTGSVTIRAAANTLPNVVLAKVAGSVAISAIENIVGVSQSGQWSTRTLDGAGDQIASATTTPAGTERGFITRNIPSGTQTVQWSGSPNVSARVFDSNGIAIASATSAPGGIDRGLVTRNIPSGIQNSTLQDISGNQLASTTSAPGIGDRALVTRSMTFDSVGNGVASAVGLPSSATRGFVTRPMPRFITRAFGSRTSVGDFGFVISPLQDGLSTLILETLNGALCTDCEVNVVAVDGDGVPRVLKGVNVNSFNIIGLGDTPDGTWAFDIAGFTSVQVLLEEFTAGQQDVYVSTTDMQTTMSPVLAAILAASGGTPPVQGQAFVNGDPGTAIMAINSPVPFSTTKPGAYEMVQVSGGAVWVRQSAPVQVINSGYNPLLQFCNAVRRNNCRPQQ